MTKARKEESDVGQVEDLAWSSGGVGKHAMTLEIEDYATLIGDCKPVQRPRAQPRRRVVQQAADRRPKIVLGRARLRLLGGVRSGPRRRKGLGSSSCLDPVPA
jgi:hypothetical protein